MICPCNKYDIDVDRLHLCGCGMIFHKNTNELTSAEIPDNIRNSFKYTDSGVWVPCMLPLSDTTICIAVANSDGTFYWSVKQIQSVTDIDRMLYAVNSEYMIGKTIEKFEQHDFHVMINKYCSIADVKQNILRLIEINEVNNDN